MRLIEAKDRHFAWMLGKAKRMGMLRLPPGGVSDSATLEFLRGHAETLRRGGCHAVWMAIIRQEIVGLCCYKTLPSETGVVDFGYGIAASRQGRGYGTAMVAALVKRAARDPSVHTLIAETRVDNLPSQHILERNGFVRDGGRLDHEDGPLVVWRQEFPPHRLSLFVGGGKKKPAQAEPARASR